MKEYSIHILLYHNIYDNKLLENTDKGSIHIDSFCEQIDTLNKNGFVNISLDDAFRKLTSNEVLEHNYYAVTFDDAFECLYYFSEPILKRIQPTSFVITDYVGQKNMWNARSTIKLNHLNLEQIIKLTDLGFDFQFHGTNHHNLVKFNEQELKQQFEEGVNWFQNKLGSKPNYISYPYGAFNQTVETVSSKYFKGAFSVNHGLWKGDNCNYKINRISVPFYVSGQQLSDVMRELPDNLWLVFENMAPWVKKNKQKS